MEDPKGIEVTHADLDEAHNEGTAREQKRRPVRSRHDPVGDIPTDLVDAVLKFIKTKDAKAFKAIFAQRVNWSSVEAMDRAHRRAIRFARKRLPKGPRIPSHIAKHLAEADLLSQATVRRFG